MSLRWIVDQGDPSAVVQLSAIQAVEPGLTQLPVLFEANLTFPVMLLTLREGSCHFFINT